MSPLSRVTSDQIRCRDDHFLFRHKDGGQQEGNESSGPAVGSSVEETKIRQEDGSEQMLGSNTPGPD